MARNATPKNSSRKPAPRQDKAIARSLAQGASTRRTSLRDRFESWRDHHLASAKDALQRMRQSLATSLMTMMVIAIAVALPAGLQILVTNASQLASGWSGNVHLSAFMKMDSTPEQLESLAQKWQMRADIERTEAISREMALEEFKLLSGFGEALDVLPENPLPALLIVFPADTHPDQLARLQASLAEESSVELVQMDTEWVHRLHAMLELAGRLVFSLGLALAAGVVLVVVNTIRLAIESRRDEIQVIKLVGGTDGFVRRPFLYTGWWFGVGGGILALILVQAVLFWIDGPVSTLAELYGSEYSLSGLTLENIISMPLTAGLLGLGGAWLAVSRHIQDIDPKYL